MKKTLTFMLLLAIAGSTSADLVKKVEGGNDIRVSLCPGMLTTSGKAIVYTLNRSTGEVTLYTPDFEVDRTFTMPVQEYTERSFTEQATVTPTGMNVVPTTYYGSRNYSSSYLFPAGSQEGMISELEARYGYSLTAFTDPMGNPACYRNDGPFKCENLLGKQYPTEWFALMNEYVYGISTNDAFYTPTYDESTAVWEVTQEETKTYSPKIRGIDSMSADGIELVDIDDDSYLTQTLFNDDEKWECVMEDRSGPAKTIYSNTNISVNEDGTVTITRDGREGPQGEAYAVDDKDAFCIFKLPELGSIFIVYGIVSPFGAFASIAC